MKPTLIFVTSNKHKIEEAQEALKEFDIQQVAKDIPEIQGTAEEIVKYKAQRAFAQLKKPCFVEDVSLCIDAWKGLPGPYVKIFMQTLKAQGVWDLVKHLADPSCSAVATIGYVESVASEKEPVLLTGVVKGKLVAPRGTGGWGFNPIFEPEGFKQTYAEMGGEAKSAISHRKKALEELHEYLKGR